MPTQQETIRERSEITSLLLLEDGNIAYATKYHGVKLIEPFGHRNIRKIIHKDLTLNITASCFNRDASLIAFASNNVIKVLDLQSKEIIKVIKTSNGYIEKLIFCDSYLVAGTKKGRVLQYRHDNSALLARICSFPHIRRKETKENYVSAFSVFENYIACSGQGGALFVIDIYTQTNRQIIIEEGIRINALCFIGKDTLVSANTQGLILVHDLKNNETTKEINAPFHNVKQIVSMPDSKFIAISGETDYIAIADIDSAKIFNAKYMKFEDKVQDMLLAHEESLVVTLENETIVNVKISSKTQLRNFIMHNDLSSALQLADDEPMLFQTREYKLLDKRYYSLYLEALSALVNQNKALAKKILSVVNDVSSKEEEIDELFKTFVNYDRFKILYLEKKYALAYAMAEKLPPLKHTPIYKRLEEVWKDQFVNAYRHITFKNVNNAKALLQEYVAVTTKQEIIRLLLNEDERFLLFLKAILTKDFQTIEEIIHINPSFKNAPTYVTLSQSVDKNIQKINLLINHGNILEAKSLLSNFKHTSFINKELKLIHYKIKNMQKLDKAYENNDFKKCYEILDTFPHLNISDLGISLNKHWAKLIYICEDFAMKANPQGIRKTLETLLFVETRKSRIGDLLRVAFHSKIKAYMSKNAFKGAEKIIYSYLDVFGNDNEIKSIMRTYETLTKRKLAITANSFVQRDKWVVNILDKLS